MSLQPANRQVGYRPARRCAAIKRAGRLGAVMAVLLMMGCAATIRDSVTYHQFQYSIPPEPKRFTVPDTVMVYRFLLDPNIDMKYLTVTESDGQTRRITTHRWRRSPADMITDLLQRDLQGYGLFRKAVDQFSPLPYRYALEGKVNTLGGKVEGKKTVAEIEAQAVLIDFEAPPGENRNILRKTYKAQAPCKSSDPDQIVKGLTLAARKLSGLLRKDIQEAVRVSRPDLDLQERAPKPDPASPPAKTVDPQSPSLVAALSG